MLLGVRADAVLDVVGVQGVVLGGAELGEDDGGEPVGGRALGAAGDEGGAVLGGVDAEGVEPVAVEGGFDGGARARVQVLAHRVQVQLPDDLVGPRMVVEREVYRGAAGGVADRSAFVARGREQVRAGGEGRQVLVVLHSREGDEQVRVGGVDGVGAGAHVADKCLPVVV